MREHREKAENSRQVWKEFTGHQTFEFTTAKIKAGEAAGGSSESIIKK